jgi:hypothetical protein
MSDVVQAELPADLADALVGEGFEEFIAFRGFLAEAGTVMTLASVGLGVGANAATILVSRDALGQFLSVVRDWVQRKAAGQPGGELAIDISARRGDDETRLRLTIESRNGIPHVDTAALTAFITSMFPDGSAAGPPPLRSDGGTG